MELSTSTFDFDSRASRTEAIRHSPFRRLKRIARAEQLGAIESADGAHASGPGVKCATAAISSALSPSRRAKTALSNSLPQARSPRWNLIQNR